MAGEEPGGIVMLLESMPVLWTWKFPLWGLQLPWILNLVRYAWSGCVRCGNLAGKRPRRTGSDRTGGNRSGQCAHAPWHGRPPEHNL